MIKRASISDWTKDEFNTALERCGFSKSQLAQRIGRDNSTVYRWATGKSPVPRYAEEYLNEVLKQLEAQ